METRITKLLGSKYPMIQGGMAWIAESTLASAVSNAGAVGLIAGGSAPIDYLREQIRICKEKTQNPFGVNIMLMSPNADDLAQLVIDEKVPIVTTGAGNPGKYMEAWNTTMCLVPQVVDAVDIPVIAAGGIADGRGIAAAFMLGAEGVQLGTRFLATEECQISPKYKELVVKAKDTDNQITGFYSGSPCRGIKTKYTKKLQAMEKAACPPEDFEAMTVGSLRKAVVDGNVDEGSFLCGLIAGMVHDVKPCKEVIDEMWAEAYRLLGKN